jgi:hypothetical protein
MADEVQTTSAESGKTKDVVLKATTTAQQQKVMDLESGREDATIEVKMTKYTAPEYDSAKYDLTEEEFNAAVMEKAAELIQPASARLAAFLNYATSASYQAGKAAALATGNYLSSDLKARIVQVMRGNQSFVDLSAKDCFERWKAGYLAKKAGALKILDVAKSLGDFGDDL